MRTVKWITLTTLGLAAGLISAFLLGGPIEKIVGMMLVTPIVTGIVGAGLGISQAVYLRSYKWIVATCLGLAAGLAGGVVLVEVTGTAILGHRPQLFHLSTPYRALSFTIVGLFAGALLGAAQQWVLRLKRWTLMTSLGLGAAFGVSSLLVDGLTSGLRSPVGAATFVIVAGIVFGSVSGIPLRARVTA